MSQKMRQRVTASFQSTALHRLNHSNNEPFQLSNQALALTNSVQ